MATCEVEDLRRAYLEALATAVEQVTELRACVVRETRSGSAVLRVVNRHAADLSEDVGCDLVEGEWWYVWSWQNTIGPADDPEGAAVAIGHVLLVRM